MSKISRRRFVEGTGAGVIAVSTVPLEAQQKKSAANEPGGAQALAAPRGRRMVRWGAMPLNRVKSRA